MSLHLDQLLARNAPTRIRWGLDRTRDMLSALGDPHREYEVLHVAGTNGKGSCAACAEAILRATGERTGLYTSPHLEDFAERIRVEGHPVGRGLLDACARDILPLAESSDATFFEAATVLAFEAFRRTDCDTVVAEVGLGGRLDATNVVRPTVTLITSVDLDHADYLGDTLEQVAAEKAGVLKAGVPAVVGAMDDRALAVVLRQAAAVDAPVHVLGRDFAVSDVAPDLEGTGFGFRAAAPDGVWPLRVPLPGRHQAINAALAVRAVQLCRPPLSRDDVQRGLSAVRWPGRFEVCRTTGTSWVLDVAHNTAAVAALAGLLTELPLSRPLVVLVAILGDKSWREMLGPLVSLADASIFTVAPSSPPARRWDPHEARRAVGSAPVEVEVRFGPALRRARELAGNGTVVVTGSAHTVGDARQWIRDQEVV